MKISKYANSVAPSLARALFNKAKAYDDVIDLTLGDPDFSTPAYIQDAACQAIKAGKTHYSANAGLKEAREAIAKNIAEHWQVTADPEKELLVTVGGMEALFLSLATLVDPGDEVIIFAPYYVNYVQMVRFLGGVPVIVNAYDEKRGIYIEEEALRPYFSDKTVAMVINSPSNPTGGVFEGETLAMLARLAKEKEVTVISDEVYRFLLYDGAKHESILSYYENAEGVILVDSCSKEFCMTGWRIGYAYGDARIIQNMVKLQENVAACAPLPSQYAMIEAYTNRQDNRYALEQFEKRRDCLCAGINRIEKLSCLKPKGTFYLFVNIERTGLGSLEFAERLLDAEHVAVVPGETYGEGYTGYIRIAFTKDVAVLEKAVEKIGKFVAAL